MARIQNGHIRNAISNTVIKKSEKRGIIAYIAVSYILRGTHSAELPK